MPDRVRCDQLALRTQLLTLQEEDSLVVLLS